MKTPYEKLKHRQDYCLEAARRIAAAVSKLGDNCRFVVGGSADFHAKTLSEECRDLIANALTAEKERMLKEADRIGAKLNAVNDLLAGEQL